ncbi:E3 ubiquitin-protein ligase CIP8-like [Phragmites australis]|uniref:E3 ubiquitin-protein ligase CIP8-like n=1 Tax=Phragmites australis TaxID=29695 RepID=UPI002D79E02D|nr:E3 ubiquitin-protein ligase CIP8-like [Phragmites australis]
MASANDGDRAAAGILRLLLGMAAGAPTSAPLPRGSRLVMVQHFIVGDDGDLFSSGVSGGGVPPASKSAIAALKEVKAGEDGVGPLGDCAICLDGVEDAAKEMPCGHQFHGECLERWLGLHGNCPVCRHELLPAAKEEDAAAADGGEERRRPRAAVVVSYLMLAGEREQQQQQQEREEPWTIRIEDVD